MNHTARICGIDEVPADGSKVVSFAWREMVIVNHAGTYYAIENRCPHVGGPLGLGQVKNGVVTCPWHRFRFELDSGRSVTNPAMRANIHRLTVDQGSLMLDLPKTADRRKEDSAGS